MECTPEETARVNTSQKEVLKILQGNGFNIFYSNHILNKWSNDEKGILTAGDVWVCRDIKQLS